MVCSASDTALSTSPPNASQSVYAISLEWRPSLPFAHELPSQPRSVHPISHCITRYARTPLVVGKVALALALLGHGSDNSTAHTGAVLGVVRDNLPSCLAKDVDECLVDAVGEVGVFLLASVAAHRRFKHNSRCRASRRHRQRSPSPGSPSSGQWQRYRMLRGGQSACRSAPPTS